MNNTDYKILCANKKNPKKSYQKGWKQLIMFY